MDIYKNVENNVTKTETEPETKIIEDSAADVRSPLSALPENYMSDGEYFGETADGKKYLKKEYIDTYAKEIAAALVTGTPKMAASAFNSSFLRELKIHMKRGVPVEAKLSCSSFLIPKSIKLVAKKKAPVLLQELIQAAVASVKDEETFNALYRHLDAIYAYMLQNENNN